MEEEDVVSEVMVRFIKGRLFEKNDEEKGAPRKYLIMCSVERSMIDLVRKRRLQVRSFEETLGENLKLEDTLGTSGGEVEDEVGSSCLSKVWEELLPVREYPGPQVRSPYTSGVVSLDLRTVYRHMILGVDAGEMAQIFHVSSTRIYQMMAKIREILRPAYQEMMVSV
jgi:DNA-directed RNA polymerase specialized sigma24 family protein